MRKKYIHKNGAIFDFAENLSGNLIALFTPEGQRVVYNKDFVDVYDPESEWEFVPEGLVGINGDGVLWAENSRGDQPSLPDPDFKIIESDGKMYIKRKKRKF